MLTRTGARLLDFGLARLRPQAASAAAVTGTVLTIEHTLLGTIPYMSPEQLRGAEVDSRSDIFSLGVVLYEALKGKRPFDGDAPASIIAAILEREPPALSSDLPQVPPGLERLIAVAWSAIRSNARSDVSAPLVHFAIQLGDGESIHEHNSSSVALAADGARIAYAVNTRAGRGVSCARSMRRPGTSCRVPRARPARCSRLTGAGWRSNPAAR